MEGYDFSIMEDANNHRFAFNEAVSFLRICETQEEIDYYWDQLSADKSAEQCGWLKDKFGVSWQIVPSGMAKILNNSDPKKAERAMKAVLSMKKLEIDKIIQAANFE